MYHPYLNTKYNLVEQFTPTKDSSGELSKARVKNANLPYLQFMYYGDPEQPMRCLITGESGFYHGKDYGTGLPKVRFRLDFNHIRQRCNDLRTAGESVDKCDTPSAMFRGKYLCPEHRNRDYKFAWRQRTRELDAFEFMTIMPILSEEHAYITQDSAKSDIVLTNFDKSTWAWCLQNADNFEATKRFLGIVHYNVEYDFIIDHLSNIEYEDLYTRLRGMFD